VVNGPRFGSGPVLLADNKIRMFFVWLFQKPTARGATAILFEGHELGHLHVNRGTLDQVALDLRVGRTQDLH